MAAVWSSNMARWVLFGFTLRELMQASLMSAVPRFHQAPGELDVAVIRSSVFLSFALLATDVGHRDFGRASLWPSQANSLPLVTLAGLVWHEEDLLLSSQLEDLGSIFTCGACALVKRGAIRQSKAVLYGRGEAWPAKSNKADDSNGVKATIRHVSTIDHD